MAGVHAALLTASFLARLRDFRFTGEVYAMREGTVFFGSEPVLRVVAPLPEAQLVESRIVNLLQYQTLVASKAASCRLAAPRAQLVDFGMRRAHGAEAACLCSRASYIAGFDATATLEASRKFGIPPAGTMAHSFVQAHEMEIEAFRNFALCRPAERGIAHRHLRHGPRRKKGCAAGEGVSQPPASSSRPCVSTAAISPSRRAVCGTFWTVIGEPGNPIWRAPRSMSTRSRRWRRTGTDGRLLRRDEARGLRGCASLDCAYKLTSTQDGRAGNARSGRRRGRASGRCTVSTTRKASLRAMSCAATGSPRGQPVAPSGDGRRTEDGATAALDRGSCHCGSSWRRCRMRCSTLEHVAYSPAKVSDLQHALVAEARPRRALMRERSGCDAGPGSPSTP